jgi:membrane-bound hydrogenase subunit beta
MTGDQMSPEEILARFQSTFGAGVRDARIQERQEGVKKHTLREIWIRIDRHHLKEALSLLAGIHYPHLGVIAGRDAGDEIELLYHLFIYYGTRGSEIPVTIAVSLPKTDLAVPTITDIIPGALVSEREKQEMLGVTVVGIPDARRMFLPDDFPEGVFPWRKDESGVPKELIKDLSEVGREKYRKEHPPKVPPEGEACETCEVDDGRQ